MSCQTCGSRALDIAEPDEKVLRLSEVQPEFKTPIWQPGDPWMIEVTVPRGYDGPTGRGNK